jgi:outer membrane receptor protein involved in Fe transport
MAQDKDNNLIEEDNNLIEEVLVTAGKRGEVSLLDIPMSIQAITGDDLDRRGIYDFEDYASQISGMSFENQGPGDKKYILRGVQSTGASTVGVYFDDIVITSNHRQDGGGRQPDIRLVDMERLEVLKGPQGTLYGASSMAGTIRMITNKPDATEFSGSVSGGIGSTKDAHKADYNTDMYLNIPIVQDKFAIRVVGYKDRVGGYIDDTLDYGIGGLGADGVDETDIEGARIAARWNISDNVTFDAMWMHQEINTVGATWYHPDFGREEQRNYQLLPWEEKLNAYNFALEWVASHGTFTATHSYMDRDIFYRFAATRILCGLFTGRDPGCFGYDISDVALNYNGFLRQPQDRSIRTTEVRYATNWSGRFQFVGGFFFQKEESEFNSRVQFAGIDGGELPASDPVNLLVNRKVIGEIDQKALFGEFTFDITDRLTGLVGFRAFDFEVDEVGQNLERRCCPDGSDPVVTNSSEDDISPKFGLTYAFSDEMNMYAAYSEGFRVGGNNEPDFNTGASAPPYTSDTLTAFELGFKGMFLDGALRMDAAIYRMDWSDLQTRIVYPVPGNPNFQVLGNVGEARIQGIEAGMTWVPSRATDFLVGGNITHLKAELTEDAPIGTGTFPGQDGDRIPDVPEFTANAFFEYGKPVFSSWEMLARLDWSYVGKSYRTFRPDDPRNREQGDYSRVDFRLMFEDQESYRLSFFIDNLLDEDGVITWFVDASLRRPDEVYGMRPRTIGVRFEYFW